MDPTLSTPPAGIKFRGLPRPKLRGDLVVQTRRRAPGATQALRKKLCAAGPGAPAGPACPLLSTLRRALSSEAPRGQSSAGTWCYPDTLKKYPAPLGLPTQPQGRRGRAESGPSQALGQTDRQARVGAWPLLHRRLPLRGQARLPALRPCRRLPLGVGGTLKKV